MHLTTTLPVGVAKATALVENTPPKAACSRPPVILVPDPTLDVTWAAAAWHNTLRARCFDEDALKTAPGYITTKQHHVGSDNS